MGRTPPGHFDQWAAWAAKRGEPRQLPDVTVPVPAAPDARDRRAAPPNWRRRPAIGLAAAAIAASLALVVLPEIQMRFAADHVTATAEVRTVHLADGSAVQLGPQSALDVAYAGNERSVRLLEGEAFFEVVSDPDRPFRVRASSIDATVLGTAFEVRLDDRGVDVAVRRGAVRVDSHDDGPALSERLEAGDWIRMASSGEVTRGVQPPAQIAAWLQGRLIVRDRPVGEVVDALRPYYGGIVILHGDNLLRQPLTGVYDLSDPVSALKAVAGAQGAETYQLSPWVLVISGG
jgi:transmembrane sensor